MMGCDNLKGCVTAGHHADARHVACTWVFDGPILKAYDHSDLRTSYLLVVKSR